MSLLLLALGATVFVWFLLQESLALIQSEPGQKQAVFEVSSEG
ncbi:MAG: hypothetical protein ACI9VM_000371 [Candidatus Azotimanducaceae bacterium]|jgi:hypothetical protein